MRISALRTSPYFSPYAVWCDYTLNGETLIKDVTEASEKEGWVELLERDEQGRLIVVGQNNIKIIRKYGKVTIHFPKHYKQQTIEFNPKTQEDE